MLLTTLILLVSSAQAENQKFIDVVEYLEENKHCLVELYEKISAQLNSPYRSANNIACDAQNQPYFYGYPISFSSGSDHTEELCFAFQIRPKTLRKRPSVNALFYSHSIQSKPEFDETNCWMLAYPEKILLPEDKPEAALNNNGGMVFFIRENTHSGPLDSLVSTRFKKLFLTSSISEGAVVSSLRLDPGRGYLCYCVNTGVIEACVGIRADTLSTVPGHSAFINASKSPIEVLQAVENEISCRLLSPQNDIQQQPHKVLNHLTDLMDPPDNPASIPGKFVSPAVQPFSVRLKDHGHCQLKVVGVGQFSVVFQLQGLPHGMYNNIVWKRISGFNRPEAEHFVLLQKLSHRIFQECNVKTENTGYFIVPNSRYLPETYSVYMAQRLIPDYEFVDFHFMRFAECDSPQNKSLLLEISSKKDIYPDKVIPLSEHDEVPTGDKYLTMTYEQMVVCIIDKILDMAAENLKDTLLRRQSGAPPAPLQICGDIKADNISVKLRIVNRSRAYSLETQLDATAEIFDTHPNTLEVHGCPVYHPEAYADHIKRFLGVDAFSVFTPAIKNLSNLPKIVIRTLACFLNYSISDERLKAVIDVTKAMIAAKKRTLSVWRDFPLETITIDAVKADHEGANRVLGKLKLQTLALQMAQELELQMSQPDLCYPSSTPSISAVPPLVSLIPISRAQDIWLRTIRSDHPQLWKGFEKAVHGHLMGLFFLTRPSGVELESSTGNINQVIETILQQVPFSPTRPTGTSKPPSIPIPIPSQLVTGHTPSSQDSGNSFKSTGSSSLSIGRKKKALTQRKVSACKPKVMSPIQYSPDRSSPQSVKGRSRPGIQTDKWISTAIDPAQSYTFSRPCDVALCTTPANWQCSHDDNIDAEKPLISTAISRHMRKLGYDCSLYTRKHASGKEMFGGSKCSPQEMFTTVLTQKSFRQKSGRTWGNFKKCLSSYWKEITGIDLLMLPEGMLPAIPREEYFQLDMPIEFMETDSQSTSFPDDFLTETVELSFTELLSVVARLPDTNQHPDFIGRELILMALFGLLGESGSHLYILDFSECIGVTPDKTASLYPKIVRFSSEPDLESAEKSMHITASQVVLADPREMKQPGTMYLDEVFEDKQACLLARFLFSWKGQPSDIWFGVHDISDIEKLVRKRIKGISRIRLTSSGEEQIKERPALLIPDFLSDVESGRTRIMEKLTSRMRSSGFDISLYKQPPLQTPGLSELSTSMHEACTAVLVSSNLHEKTSRTWKSLQNCLRLIYRQFSGPQGTRTSTSPFDGTLVCSPPQSVTNDPLVIQLPALSFPSHSYDEFTLEEMLGIAMETPDNTHACIQLIQEKTLAALFALLGKRPNKLYLLDFTEMLAAENSSSCPMPRVTEFSSTVHSGSSREPVLEIKTCEASGIGSEHYSMTPHSILEEIASNKGAYCVARVNTLCGDTFHSVWFGVHNIESYQSGEYSFAPTMSSSPCNTSNMTLAGGFNTHMTVNSSEPTSGMSDSDFLQLSDIPPMTDSFTMPIIKACPSPARELFHTVYEELSALHSGPWLSVFIEYLTLQIDHQVSLSYSGNLSARISLLRQALMLCSEYRAYQRQNQEILQLIQPCIDRFLSNQPFSISQSVPCKTNEDFIYKFSCPEHASFGAQYLLEPIPWATTIPELVLSKSHGTIPFTSSDRVSDDVFGHTDSILLEDAPGYGSISEHELHQIGPILKQCYLQQSATVFMLCLDIMAFEEPHLNMSESLLHCPENHSLCNLIIWADAIARSLHLANIPVCLQLNLSKETIEAQSLTHHCGYDYFTDPQGSPDTSYILQLPIPSKSQQKNCSLCCSRNVHTIKLPVATLINPGPLPASVSSLSNYSRVHRPVSCSPHSTTYQKVPSVSSGSSASPFMTGTSVLFFPDNSSQKSSPGRVERGFKAGFKTE
ncbi:hypothetical protein [Spongorhabdus nitratireducens]